MAQIPEGEKEALLWCDKCRDITEHIAAKFNIERSDKYNCLVCHTKKSAPLRMGQEINTLRAGGYIRGLRKKQVNY